MVLLVIDFVRRSVSETLMESPIVVEVEVLVQSFDEFRSGSVFAQIEMFVLERFPEAFDDNIIERASFRVHADLDASFDERLRKDSAGELTSLIGIDDLGLRILCQSFYQHVAAKVCFERIGYSPVKHIPAFMIDDCHQIPIPLTG